MEEPATESENEMTESVPPGVNPRQESVTEVTYQTIIETHVEFTFIADNKAYVMVCTNSIIIGALTTLLLPRLNMHPNLAPPTMLMFAICLISLAYSMVSIRPELGKGVTSRKAVKDRKANILFFGNFHKMSFEDFNWAIRRIIHDDEQLMDHMVRDIYFLGRGLGAKYRQVRISYDIFLVGMIISVIAFVIAIFTSA